MYFVYESVGRENKKRQSWTFCTQLLYARFSYLIRFWMLRRSSRRLPQQVIPSQTSMLASLGRRTSLLLSMNQLFVALMYPFSFWFLPQGEQVLWISWRSVHGYDFGSVLYIQLSRSRWTDHCYGPKKWMAMGWGTVYLLFMFRFCSWERKRITLSLSLNTGK